MRLRPALFLDRDGVINVDRAYVHRIDDFEFVPGIFELGRAAHLAGFLLIVVTNQAGIGRGLYSEADFHALSNWMCARFEAEGAPITQVYFCATHPQAVVERYRLESDDRKPGPGMLLRAAAQHGIDLPASMLVGDKGSDIEAGLRAGVGTNVLLNGNTRDAGAIDARAIRIDGLIEAIGLLSPPTAGPVPTT